MTAESPTRTHIAKDQGPRIALHSVSQEKHRRHKPAGFWYEVDGDWRRWCKDEDWGLTGEEVVYSVELRGVNLLQLQTPDEILAFTETYGRPEPEFRSIYEIDWLAVATKWDGIEIAPYQWSLRLDMATSWYYSWDCASGVLWEPRDSIAALGVLSDNE